MVEIARHVRVTGRVQGVGFRAWTRDEAVARGLAGWVRNEPDGAVTAVIAGPETAVEAMLAAVQGGPRFARVAAVEVRDAEMPEGRSFEIRR